MNNLKIEEIFPKNNPVIFFHAHSDDESFLSAGLLNKLSKMGRRCIVVYGAASTVEGEEKTFIRKQHAIESCSILGIDHVVFLKYCEPKYNGLPLINQTIEDISYELLKVLKGNDINLPISLVSYDKNGGYGNRDHKIIHLVGRNVKTKYQNLISLSEVTLNRDKISKWIKEAKIKLEPRMLPQLEYWYKNFGLLDKEIQFRYKLNNIQLNLKRKALAVHTFYNKPDQFPLGLSESDFNKVFGEEYLHL